MNDVHPEGINCIPADIIPEDPGDEHLPLVVVAEEPPNHDCVYFLTASAFSSTLSCARGYQLIHCVESSVYHQLPKNNVMPVESEITKPL